MKLRYTFTLLLLLAAAWQTAYAQRPDPGTVESLAWQPPASKSSMATALTPFFSYSGEIYVSIDGLGMTSPSGLIQVEKPNAGASVASAHLFSAMVWFGNHTDGNVTLNGNAIIWDAMVQSAAGAPQGNARKDVTSIVKPVVDAAAPGLINFNLQESGFIDGEVLVVIFDDPAQTATSSVILAFGAQATAGDNFAVTLAEPFAPAEHDINMSLGISFGFQPAGQFSIVDVNGARLTSSAGGYDDGQPADGALLTAGGIGDDPANPADPNQTDGAGPLYDDELYTLDPLLTSGATNISVHTQNPSNNDNMFFAAFMIKGTSAIVGEGILLAPVSATKMTGESHTFTATVQDDDGNPVAGRLVTFSHTGPHATGPASGITNASGQATYTFTGIVAGEDIVTASFVDSQGNTLTSNPASVLWTSPAVCTASTFVESVDYTLGVVTLTISDPEGIVQVNFTDPSDNPVLVNFTVANTSGGFSSSDGIRWSAATPGPVSAEFELTATGDQATYMAQIVNGCQFITDIDPVHNMASHAASFAVEGNYPNPFDAGTTIRFSVPEASAVTVTVYDVMGREVRTLVDGELGAGPHEIVWDGRDASGRGAPSGVYLYRVQAGSQVQTRSMTLLK